MLMVAETLLKEPDRSATPETLADMLRRLIELLKVERAKRPAHRPAAGGSPGAEAAILINAGMPKKTAIKWVMKRRNIKSTTVERDLRDYRAQPGGEK
jgi:hypothetical protein